MQFLFLVYVYKYTYIHINHNHIDLPHQQISPGPWSVLVMIHPFFLRVFQVIDYAYFSMTEFQNQQKDFRDILIRLPLYTDPLCGVKLPLATFLSLPMFHMVPFSWCKMCIKQISKFSPATSMVFYQLRFSLSVINLSFAFNVPSPAFARNYSVNCVHIYQFI